jgi:hypothetical protein
LRIRACALTLSTSCRVLMCTCHALCLSAMSNHSFPSISPLLQPRLIRNLAGNGSSKPSASPNSTSCSQASRTRLLRQSALSLTAKVPAMSLLSSREGRRYVCAYFGVCCRRVVADSLGFRVRLLRLVDRLISVSLLRGLVLVRGKRLIC